MTGCAFSPNEVVEKAPAEVIGSGTLQFEAKGEYDVSRVKAQSVMYRFGAPNEDIVVYQMPGTVFLVGEYSDNRSISYAANMFIKDGEFVALSDKYLLFATVESNGMVAVAVEADGKNKYGIDLMLEIPFEDLSEEEKDDLSRLENDLCFVIDPLDGTKEFIKQNGQFTVNIALSYRHRTVMGVIYVPVTGELYYAAKGHGSFMEENGKCIRLHVNSEDKQKSDLNVVMRNSHGAAEMDALIKKYGLKNYVKVGSSLKGCMIAKGAADVYYRFGPTMEWDTAAMQCIVEEAGGLLRQMDGTEMLYNREDSLNRKGFYILNRIENILE
jgi:3'(2'), 5'-bisphosphate nucleotidase